MGFSPRGALWSGQQDKRFLAGFANRGHEQNQGLPGGESSAILAAASLGVR